VIKHAADGMMLAASHLIGPESYQADQVATFLAGILLARYPAQLKMRYGVDPQGMDGNDLIAAIAAKRGYLGKGGTPEPDKAARALLQDYRSGALGRVTLETPAGRGSML
jgi:ribosome biogenesis GTPase A